MMNDEDRYDHSHQQQHQHIILVIIIIGGDHRIRLFQIIVQVPFASIKDGQIYHEN